MVCRLEIYLYLFVQATFLCPDMGQESCLKQEEKMHESGKDDGKVGDYYQGRKDQNSFSCSYMSQSNIL